jgi:hypothetical protein
MNPNEAFYDKSQPQCMPISPEKPPILVSRILEALYLLGYPKRQNLLIHVSVAKNTSIERFQNDLIRVRWLCWSILCDQGEIRPPEYEVLSEDISRERLEQELPIFFPGVSMIVDDDI